MATVLKEIHPFLGASEFYSATADAWRRGIIDPVFYTAMAWSKYNSGIEKSSKYSRV
ncbi:hypothetical protein [Algoriphagus sp.]|uniref:hypothetical protein n=1 Tax=Algoriphagus sp. TaxID=1872435 RepID=UPI00391C62D3